MMLLSDLPVGGLYILGIFLSLICAFALMGLIHAAGKKEVRSWFLASSLVFAVCFAILYGVEWKLFALQQQRELSAYAGLILRLPLFVAAAVTCICGLLTTVAIVSLRRRLRGVLSEQSVIEGLDKLPDGIFFSAADGMPLLVNEKMHEICYQAFGLTTMDYAYFKRRIGRNELCPGCVITRHENSTFLTLPDKTVWSLREGEFDSRFGRVTELIAVDVTEQYRSSEELMQRNERLSAVNAQIKETNRSMDKIIREKEILSAKIRLHDALGSSLLLIRSYFTQPDTNREALISQLQTSVFLFHRDPVSTEDESIFTFLEEAAGAIGVKIEYDGPLPKEHRTVIAAAIHECVTNTVKHAGGKTLYIETRRSNSGVTVRFTNDGAPPRKSVKETGGLANLRKLTQDCGVEMQVESAPRFALTLRIPREQRKETGYEIPCDGG